jgi:hypothetical protein
VNLGQPSNCRDSGRTQLPTCGHAVPKRNRVSAGALGGAERVADCISDVRGKTLPLTRAVLSWRICGRMELSRCARSPAGLNERGIPARGADSGMRRRSGDWRSSRRNERRSASSPSSRGALRLEDPAPRPAGQVGPRAGEGAGTRLGRRPIPLQTLQLVRKSGVLHNIQWHPDPSAHPTG